MKRAFCNVCGGLYVIHKVRHGVFTRLTFSKMERNANDSIILSHIRPAYRAGVYSFHIKKAS